MRVLIFAPQKVGVGKTILTGHPAVELTEKGRG